MYPFVCTFHIGKADISLQYKVFSTEVGHTMDNGDSKPNGRNLILMQTLPYHR